MYMLVHYQKFQDPNLHMREENCKLNIHFLVNSELVMKLKINATKYLFKLNVMTFDASRYHVY